MTSIELVCFVLACATCGQPLVIADTPARCSRKEHAHYRCDTASCAAAMPAGWCMCVSTKLSG